MRKIINIFKDFISWIRGIFNDEKGNPSSKRIVGMGCATTLCATMYNGNSSPEDFAIAGHLVDSVALLAFGCLGLTSFDKFTDRKRRRNDDEEPN